MLSIDEIASLGRFGSWMGLDFGGMAREFAEQVRRIRIKVGSGRDPPTSLSGGNQQKVILVLDEPTRGIDVHAKFEIQTVLRGLCDAGLSAIYISSELAEVLEVTDRILVLHEGEVKGAQRADEATRESLLQTAMS